MTPVLISLGALVIAVLLAVGCSQQRDAKSASAQSSGPVPLELDATPDKPIGFGYKNAWLAIKTDESSAVARTLGLSELEPANWESGLHTSYSRYETHVFVTPPVEGWVFVVGIALPDAGDSERPDRCTPVLESLGQAYDSVYYFGTHRIVEFHAWVQVKDGSVSRAYAYLGERGETIWDRGEKTAEENRLGFNFFADEPPRGQGEKYWDRKDLRSPNEEDVINIAEEWTLNPLSIDSMDLPESVGLVGRVPSTWK